MTKKLKSLNPIIGTGYKTLSTIKDGEDGNIENFPDTLPKIPRLSYKRLGVSGLEIGWEFEDKIYYTYELYGSTTKGFKASEENLIFQGLASSYFYEAKPGEKWYFKARAKNTHGRYTEFSSELVTYTIKLDNLGDYVEGGSINGALIENATINNAHIKDLHADKITAGVLDADRIGANSITANKIEANAITSEKIQANAITTDKLAANIIASNHIQSGTITSGHIQSGTIESGHIKAGTIESGHIKAGTIESNHIKSNSINSNHIQANTIQSEHIQTGAITAGSGIIAEGAIGSAQISSLDATKIEAGTIDTSKVIIQGSNGHLRIKGNRLQVFNGTGNQAKERVSVGDVNGDGTIYGLRVRGADGKTVLLDENGVKSEGITNGAITNDKISDNAEIDGAKLNINSVVNKINEDGTETIQGTKIEVNGTSLVTKLSSITNKQTEDSNKITQAQSQITANTNAIKLKVDEQTYQSDKEGIETSLNKHTSEISTMKGQIALKVEQTDIANAKSELEGKIDTKVASAKAEIKATTDSISQSVSNLSNTVSTKADGTTVSNLSSKVGTLETSVNGITGRVSNVEKTTTTLGTQVDTAQSTADSAVNKADKAQTTANTNKNNISSLQGEVSTVKSNVASLEVTTSGISQKVSNVESTTTTLTTQVGTAQSTADSKAKVFTSTPTVPYKVGDLWVQGTSGDVMKCKTARTSGSYTASDWEKASKYTDDTKANAVDSKVGTLQTTVNTTNSKVAELTTNLDSITQRVSSTESTTTTLTEKVNVTVKDVKVYYAINTSSTTAPTSGWSTTPPTWVEGKYIWSKTTTTLTNGQSTTTNPVCITGATGATGQTGAKGDKGDKGDTGATGASGKGVKSITNYYLASTANSGVTTSTSGWTTTVQSVSNSKKYLWNYEKVIYTDNTNTSTTPCIIGAYGDTGATGATGAAGKGIKSIVEYYAVSSSNTTAPTSWSTTMQNTTTTNKYLWNYEVITYTDNSTTSTTKKVIGTHGATGDKGATGATGATGTGIESITTEYYLSTSKTTQTGGSWVTTQPQWSNGKYLWTRSKIVYKNPTSTAYTTPVCDSSYDAINDVNVGSRNLILDTSFKSTWGAYNSSVVTIEKLTTGNKKITWKGTSQSAMVSNLTVPLEKNTVDYTLSFDARGTLNNVQAFILSSPTPNLMIKGWTSQLSSTDFKKFTITFKYAHNNDSQRIFLGGTPSATGEWIEFKKDSIKLEKGNKATDWTPAPEDVQSQIDTNKTNISTTSSKVAEITTSLDSITQRVASTESTLTTTTNKINNLQIGGRNFVTNSNKFNAGSGANDISATVGSDGVLAITASSGNGNWYTGWGRNNNTHIENSFNEGDEVTISFTMKSPTGTKIPSVYFKNGMGYYAMSGNISTNYSTVYCTTKWKKANGLAFHLGFQNAIGTYYIKDWKIEKGSKPTSWTPAPEDVDSSIASVDSKVQTTNNKVASIETNLNGITQRVSSTESTVSSHTTQLGTVDSRINTAKNSAISTASSDATTKANNALASAKTDATTKANNALADAKTYTNGQITTVNTTINNKVAEIKATTDAITQRVSSTETITNEMSGTVNNLKSSHGLAYAKDIIVYGDSDKYYPVYIIGGNQDVLRTIKIWRFYGEQAPNDWNSSTHKASLVFEWLGNFGGWGGATYSEKILEHTVCYAPTLANCHIDVYSQGYVFYLRGGGTNGAIYHFASDQSLSSLKAYYNGSSDLVWSSGEHKVYAKSPLTSVDTARLNGLKVAKESSVTAVDAKVTTTNSKVATLETNLNGITQRVSSTESTTATLITEMDAVDGKINTAKNSAVSSAVGVKDTRNDNQNPSWYITNYPQRTVEEFKYANVIGIGSSSVFGVLTTVVPWGNTSGGYPTQTFRSNSTATYTRKGTSTTAWGAWSQLEDTAGSQAKATQALNDAKTFTTTEVTKTNNKVASLETNLNSITSRVSSVESTSNTTILLAKAMSNGKMVHTDPMFKKSANEVYVYNNSGNGTVTVNRISKVSGCPTTSTHCIEVKTTGTASPGNGGFYQAIHSRANAIFIQKFLAKVPSGLTLNVASNSMGDGYSDRWLTSNKGTGKWEEYIREVRCGSTGTFSMGGHVYVSGASPTTSSPLVWYVGMCTVYDITDSDERITDLTSRVSTAESKLTKDSLTTTIGSHYTTSSDVNGLITSKGYATTSQVQQTKNELTATFKESGGYNKIFNSYINTTSSAYGFGTRSVDASKLIKGKTYTLSMNGRKTNASNTGYPVVFFYASDWSWSTNVGVNSTTDTTQSVTFTLPTSVDVNTLNVTCYHYPSGSTGSSHINWIQLTEGSIEQPWSPHPSEIYDGITAIDKDGIKVSQSNYNGYTQMKADGFYVNNGSENVISVTKDGATFKGKVTIQSGSTVPTSTLSGTISNSQLNSTITSDISTAKTNASTALSTANSVNTTVNNGKTNWNNAYNRVNEWAYGAVTGSTTIDGGLIQSNTIVADKIKTGSITATQIAARTITASEIASNAITADKIASSSITSSKIASGAITANMITSGTMSANRITGGTLKSTNGSMYFDMDNGYMILYNNGTKVGQTLMNSISGTSIYGISNGCEYGSYSTMSAKTSSSASTYTMMLSVAGQDLSNKVKYGVNLGTILSSHGNNFNLHNTYLCFGLGASSYSTVGQIRWYSDSSNWSWIGITNSNNIGLFGQGGVRLGARVSSSNTSYIGADANADSYSCKAHIWSNLNMHNWKIRYCQGVSTASLEINEEIPFARSASSDGEEGEILTNSYNVVKTKQNIVETMGSVAITEDMVDKEVYIELDAYMAYKNYMVILSPVGEDRKVCVLRKEDDGFYIKGNKGEVDYIIKYECIDVARYRNSTGEDAPENIVEEKENEPKPIILEEQI